MYGFPVGVSGYQSLGLLGQGASGQVFKARQRSTGQFVAVKIPNLASLRDPAASRRVQQRLHQETRVLAMLQHSHVVRLVDKGMAEGGMLFTVLEFLPGETLRDFLLRSGKLPLLETIGLMAQLLDALAFLHMRHIVHRDLKPENVMVMSTGTALHVKVLDFGLASYQGEPLFMMGAEGTPAYCAPEQLRGELCVPATDIYAWALMFVECLSARPCVQGANFNEVLRQQLSASAIVLPDELTGHALGALLQRALQKDVRQRTADAAGLYAELAQCLKQLHGGHQAPPAEVPALARIAAAGSSAQVTLDNMQAEAGVLNEAHVLVILCVGLRLYPEKNSSLALPDLQGIREQQMRWCANAVQDGRGRSVGVLGDCMLFYFDQGASSAQNLHQAAMVALDLRKRVQRRRRLLEIQHGVHVELSGGIHRVALASRSDVSSRNQGANVALHLNSLAEPGEILVSQDAHPELAASMLLEQRLGAASASHDEREVVFRLLADQAV